jgi:tetratricopeptide (TPR) repeat protein
MGRYDRAAAAFSSASDATPADARPCRMLSESLLRIAAATQDPTRKREIYTQAMAAAQRLMRIQPGDPEAVGLLGRAALGAGRFSAAESAFNSVLSVHPGACHVLIDLSRALLGLDRAGDAEAALDGASRCASSMAEVPEGLGRVYFRQMRFDKALDAFLRANSIQPSSSARAGIEAVRAEIEARRDGPARKDRASRQVGPSR